MEKKVIRSGIFVKVIGIITTAIFSLVSFFLAITGNIMASICFLPFAALGILLLLAYKKEMILVEEDRLIFFHLQRYPMSASCPSGQPDTDGPCGLAV